MKLPLKNKNRTMNLLTKTCLKGVPNLLEQEAKGDNTVFYLKFFLHHFTWYLSEINPETGEAFGIVVSQHCPNGEFGYFSLIELSQLQVGFCAVERDRYFSKMTLKKLNESLAKGITP